jgi:hypothetical protein
MRRQNGMSVIRCGVSMLLRPAITLRFPFGESAALVTR